MAKPRLLVIASTFPAREGDGTPAFVRELAIEVSTDFEVMVVTPRVPGAPREESDGPLVVRRYAYFPRRWENLADGAIIDNLRSHRLRYLQVLPFFVGQYFAVRRAVRQFRPDVMHVHWIIPQGIVARLAARRVPQLVTTLGGDLYALNAAPLRALKGWVVRGARRVTVMNEDMRSRVIALGASPSTTSVEPMGARLGVSSGSSLRRSPATGKTLRLLFVGRLVEKKGLPVLLDALRRCDPATRVSLTVVGDGPLRDALVAEAGTLDVQFAGQQTREQLWSLYHENDVAVFPYVRAKSGDQDGLPVALLEALGAGCAVIGSDQAGINEVVAHEKTGLLVAPGDSAALAAAIDRLAADRALVTTLGAAGKPAAAEFTVEAVGARYRGILTQLLAE